MGAGMQPLHSTILEIETRDLKNSGPGETRIVYQTQNPGLEAAETRVSGFCFFSAASVHFNNRSCYNLMRLYSHSPNSPTPAMPQTVLA